jgi:hypothetical protein
MKKFDFVHSTANSWLADSELLVFVLEDATVYRGLLCTLTSSVALKMYVLLEPHDFQETFLLDEILPELAECVVFGIREAIRAPHSHPSLSSTLL